MVKWLAAVSSQHGLSQDVVKWLAAVSTVCLRMWSNGWQQSARSVSGCGQAAGSSQKLARSVSGCGQVVGSSQQSARSVSGCGQVAGSSQHGLSQDGDNLEAPASTVCLKMWTSSWQQSARSVSGRGQVVGSRRQSARSVSRCGLVTGSSQHYTQPARAITYRENLDYLGTYEILQNSGPMC